MSKVSALAPIKVIRGTHDDVHAAPFTLTRGQDCRQAGRADRGGAALSAPRSLRANNPGPFTLDGTRTWIVGRREVAIVDPGADADDQASAFFLFVSAVSPGPDTAVLDDDLARRALARELAEPLEKIGKWLLRPAHHASVTR